MSNFITLFIVGIMAYVVIELLFSGLIDNSGEIDLEKERKLTRLY